MLVVQSGYGLALDRIRCNEFVRQTHLCCEQGHIPNVSEVQIRVDSRQGKIALNRYKSNFIECGVVDERGGVGG